MLSLLRVVRWTLRFFAREFAFQYIAILVVLIAIAVALGAAESTFGLVILAALGLLMLVEIRFAWLAVKTTRAIEAELREEVPGDPPESRFPKCHLWFPLLMLWSRAVKVERGVVFHSEEKRRVRLDIYRPAEGVPDGERRPALIQVHGGGWILGSRAEQGIPLLNQKRRSPSGVAREMRSETLMSFASAQVSWIEISRPRSGSRPATVSESVTFVASGSWPATFSCFVASGGASPFPSTSVKTLEIRPTASSTPAVLLDLCERALGKRLLLPAARDDQVGSAVDRVVEVLEGPVDRR